jgi:hypothetical protein
MVYLTIVAGLLVLLAAFLAAVIVYERAKHAEILAEFSKAAERERLELIAHIKRPEYISPREGTRQSQQPQPHPNLAKIGHFATQDS